MRKSAPERPLKEDNGQWHYFGTHDGLSDYNGHRGNIKYSSIGLQTKSGSLGLVLVK